MITSKHKKIVIVILLAWLLGLSSAFGEQVRIASAANFTAPMRELAGSFERQTGHKTQVSFASSGKLYAQIAHGAPYDVFFSADQDKPHRLIDNQLAQSDSQFTYAVGVLALWSNEATHNLSAKLAHAELHRIALANPKLAPFGAAAIEVLEALHVDTLTKPMLVKGDNVSQAYQFVHSGNANAGFVALSQIKAQPNIRGSVWIVPAHLHSPIFQDAVVLNNGIDNPAAYSFIRFVKTPAARTIIQKYGYSFESLPINRELANVGRRTIGLYSAADIQAIRLTVELALIVTGLLLIIGTPIAYWLAHTRSKMKAVVNAIVALPLVLPPSVLGFYLLIAMGPNGFLGQITQSLGLPGLAFSFQGLVVASILYSLPFVVQPIQNAMVALGKRPMEVAATLGAGPIDTFFNVTLPLAKPGFFTAAVLGFAHTIGEFGVVLMIGGNIPGETQVISVQIYEHVETLDYRQAHVLSLTMVLFSFVVLALLYGLQKPNATKLHGA